MEYYIYKITCLCGRLKDHYYIGKHQNNQRWDSYTGSGKIIKDYFKKYHARKNVTYTKEILEYNETFEDNDRREKEIIGDLWMTDPTCLNKKGGGGGGVMPKGEDNPWFGGHHTEETKKKISVGNKGKKKSPEHCKHLKDAKKGKHYTSWCEGKHLSEETKKKISETKKLQYINNPEYIEHLREIHKGKPNPSKGKPRPHTRGANSPSAVACEQQDLEGNTIRVFSCLVEAERETGISFKHISACCLGKRKTAGGYKWKRVVE